jgi:hypothetical protein
MTIVVVVVVEQSIRWDECSWWHVSRQPKVDDVVVVELVEKFETLGAGRS